MLHRFRMKNLLQRAAPVLILTGVLSVAFGIILFTWPGITLLSLVWLFTVLAFVRGISHVIMAIRAQDREEYWWWLLLLGVVNVTGGLFALAYPAATALFLIVIMGCTWLVEGVLQVIVAIQLRREIRGEGWLILAGLASMAVGIYIVTSLRQSAMDLIGLITIYAILFGMLMILFGFKARAWIRHYDEDLMY